MIEEIIYESAVIQILHILHIFTHFNDYSLFPDTNVIEDTLIYFTVP